jgi:hypothetical protein
MSNQTNSYFRFYTESNKHILVGDEKQENGYIECRLYQNGRYGPFLRGCCGRIVIIELENGYVIKTNDLWYIAESWTKSISGEEMTGKIIDDSTEVSKYKETDIHKSMVFSKINGL